MNQILKQSRYVHVSRWLLRALLAGDRVAVILFIASGLTPWLIASPPSGSSSYETATCSGDGGWHSRSLWTPAAVGPGTCSEDAGAVFACATPALAGTWLLALLCALQQVLLGNRSHTLVY